MRPLRVIAHAHVHAGLFVFALLAGFFIHFGALPLAREAVRLRINRVLSPVFLGTITIDRLGSLGLARVDGIDAHVDDDAGARVITASGASADIALDDLLRSLFRSTRPLAITIPSIMIANATVHLDADENGVPRIARAFALRSPPKEGEPPGRGARVELSRIHLVHAFVAAQPSAPYDADVDDADASLSFSSAPPSDARALASAGLAIDVARARLRVRGLPEGAVAAGHASAHVRKPEDRPLALRAAWEGDIGAIHERAGVTLDGSKLDAAVDAGPAAAADVRAVWAQWPLAAAVSVHGEAHGELPTLAVAARVTIGDATRGASVAVSGPVTIGAAIGATLHLDAGGLDGQMLATPLPFANARATGDVGLTLRPSGDASAHAAVALDALDWGDETIPALALTADFARTPDGAQTAQGNAVVREPGAPTTISFRLAPKGDSFVVSFDGTTSAPRLQVVPHLHAAVLGSASARFLGTIDLGPGTIGARAFVTAADLHAGTAIVDRASAEASVSGSLRAPVVRIAAEGDALAAGPLRASAFRAAATITTDGGLALHDVDVSLDSEGETARLNARTVRIEGGIEGGGVSVDDGVVLGLGAALEGAFQASPATVTVRADSAGIDFARIGAFVATPLKAGTVAVHLDAAVKRDTAEGSASLDLTRGDVTGFGRAAARVDVTVHGRQIQGRAAGEAEGLGRFDVSSSSLEVGPGSLMSASPWRQAWGAVDVDATADLAECFARFARAAPPSPQAVAVQGQASIGLRLERDSPSDVTPELELTVATSALAISAGTPPHGWRIANVNPRLHALVNGETGATAISLELNDAAGALVKVQASSAAVPYASVLSGFSSDSVVAALRAMPFTARIEAPPRALASYPAFLQTTAMRGILSANVDWGGTVDHPSVSAVATLARGPADPKTVALPLDLAVAAHYDGARVVAALSGGSRGKTVLEADATVDALAPDLLAGLLGHDVPWTASARARFQKVQLRNIPALDSRQVQGTVSGEITLSKLHDDASAGAALTFDGLQVGEATCRAASLRAVANGHGFDGTLEIDDAKGGHLQTSARAGLHWGRALVPALDVSQPAQATLTAKRFRAALLLPFVSGTFTELDGTIDADARIAIDAARSTAAPEGSIRLTDGAFELTSMGGEFHGVTGALVLSPDGIVRVQNLIAHGTSGQVLASATARLSGFAIAAARATVQMPRTDPLPLVFEGVSLGQIDGRLDVALDRTATGMAVDLQVPSLHLALPAGSASRDVQALGGIEGVTIGVDREGEFVEVPLDPSPPSDGDKSAAPGTVRIAVHLGSDVEVSRGTDLDVRLEGQPVVTLGSAVRVSGQIRLSRGTIDVKGKDFTIERGTVTFVGDDPSNPQVVLSAGWTAPDGTRIYADFVGPLKTGKVTLRAEPALAQNEILALLLFGTTEDTPGGAQAAAGATGSSSDQSTNQGYLVGAQAGGAVATQPINQALGGLNRTLDRWGLSGGVSTKVDTSTANPRPEVGIQIARDISLQVGWVLGVPPISNPDTTLVTLSWSFLRKWSLQATYGDQGTSILDVVWQHRY